MFEAWEIELHGHRMLYRMAGSGPPVVLIHGMVNSSRHWEKVALDLASDYTVIAPDLLGHGDSAVVRGDYSLGAHAASIRDLLASIGIDRASVVGHSLGGGVAMQFFYQFPQRVERLALVSSGGLGPEVSPLLRGAALPGARRCSGSPPTHACSTLVDGVAKGVYARAWSAPCARSGSPRLARRSLQTLRAVIDRHGQRVSARDRLYLLESFPTLIVWGERDNTIPLAHGRAAHEAIPGSRFETLAAGGPLPEPGGPGGPGRGAARIPRNDRARHGLTTRTGAPGSRPPDAVASRCPSSALARRQYSGDRRQEGVRAADFGVVGG